MNLTLFFIILSISSIYCDVKAAENKNIKRSLPDPSYTSSHTSSFNHENVYPQLQGGFTPILNPSPIYHGGFTPIVGHQSLPSKHTVSTIDNPVHFTVPQPFPVTINKALPYPVHVGVPVHVPRPIHVPVPHPVHIPVPRPVHIIAPRPVPVPVQHKIPVEITQTVGVPVPHPYPVNIPQPIAVPQPIVQYQHFPVTRFSSVGLQGIDLPYGLNSIEHGGLNLASSHGFQTIGEPIESLHTNIFDKKIDNHF